MKRRLKTTTNNLNKYLWQKLDETYMKTLIIHLFFTRTPFYPSTPTKKIYTFFRPFVLGKRFIRFSENV